MVAPIIYENGTRFGKWMIIGEGASNKQGKTWMCKCECGFERAVAGTRLRNGTSKSCGCDSIQATKKALWRGHGEIGSTLFTSFRNSAKKRNIPFLVTIENIWELFLTQNRLCALTKIPLEMYSFSSHWIDTKGLKGGMTGRRTNGTASLDRIDSSKDYTLDNIQWVHKDVNRMKMDLSESAFIDLCRKVVEMAK